MPAINPSAPAPRSPGTKFSKPPQWLDYRSRVNASTPHVNGSVFGGEDFIRVYNQQLIIMKLSLAVVASICGLTTAHSNADGYLFRSKSTAQQAGPTPELQRQLTRLILQQRLGVDKHFSSLQELSSLPNTEDAISYINEFGRPEAPLFEAIEASPSQLLIIIEGLEEGDMNDLIPSVKKSFAIKDAPNSAAIRNLVDGEFRTVGVRESSCEFGRAINPLDENCWAEQSSIIRYDAKKHTGLVEALQKAAPKLQRYAETGEMETTILAFPEMSRKSKISAWSSHPVALRRRQVEAVLSADPIPVSSENPQSPPFAASRSAGSGKHEAIPACFQSWAACVNKTDTCSGHGCTPFALFVGFTIIMVAIVAGALSLLYSIGEEPLPGVLGAGVVKR
ncbi:unnamed protein product [Parascedosporium putredinis]|uniref:Uncharacterized protein n=1 Tax=Parascedosporium putredinis TaxID=1442378 RepID=A0A9P1HB18_9PEZI|nr:unnamed protein product [Parascedosporium putredinis]CAI8001878.1 unnamed protein product [Parascedosporium putredinis]